MDAMDAMGCTGGVADGTSIMEQWKRKAHPDWNTPDARDCSFLAARIITGKYISLMGGGGDLFTHYSL